MAIGSFRGKKMLQNIEKELESIKSKTAEMFNVAYSMIMLSKSILENTSQEKVDTITKMEENINKCQIYTDQISYTFLGLFSPHAKVLRFVIMCIKISDELERIGDLSINIVKNASFLDKSLDNYLKSVIWQMYDKIDEMFNLARISFAQDDMESAKKVLKMDTEVDNLKLKVLHDMMSEVSKNPMLTQDTVTIILIAKNLERVADHLTNIAEETLYIASGLDIRHHNIKL